MMGCMGVTLADRRGFEAVWGGVVEKVCFFIEINVYYIV
jgi:hypothetical protein